MQLYPGAVGVDDLLRLAVEHAGERKFTASRDAAAKQRRENAQGIGQDIGDDQIESLGQGLLE